MSSVAEAVIGYRLRRLKSRCTVATQSRALTTVLIDAERVFEVAWRTRSPYPGRSNRCRDLIPVE